MNDYVISVVALDGPEGQICAFSTELWPGLVAINANASPCILAEQVVHEATHVALDMHLARSDFDKLWLDRLPAMWSPFQDAVRPGDRIAHGIAAYSAVEALWVGIENAGERAGITPASASRRLRTLDDRISRACDVFNGLLTAEECERWASLLASVVSVPRQSSPRNAVLPRVDGSVVRALSAIQGLGAVQSAEILLALLGEKVSRVSLPPSDARKLIDALPPGAGVCFGRQLVVPELDESLGDFSNVVAEVHPIGTDVPGAELFAYIADRTPLAREAHALDQIESAGRLFGIPDCCQDAFRRRWPEAVEKFGGDVARMLKLEEELEGDEWIPWECDTWAHYRGGGFTWHFPCSLRCEMTVAQVQRYLARIMTVAPELCATLLEAYRPGDPIADGTSLRWSQRVD